MEIRRISLQGYGNTFFREIRDLLASLLEHFKENRSNVVCNHLKRFWKAELTIASDELRTMRKRLGSF